MDEFGRRQDDGARRTVSATSNETRESNEAMLEQAVAMSLATDSTAPASTAPSVPDFASMKEEEQIAYAMKMSLQQINEGSDEEATLMETDDPKALRVSMDELGRRQDDGARRTVSATSNETRESNEAMLEQAVAMSLATDSTAPASTAPSVPDFASMKEEEQIAYAMKMSLQQIISSPVVQGEDGSGAVGIGGMGFEFGVDPNEDPELALNGSIILLKEGTENQQGKPQIISNINACQAVADAVRTTLGPRGMDKLIVDGKGKTIISNDGATIIKELEVVHPAAKTLVDIAKSQDAEDELAKEMEELEQEELDEQLLAAGPSAAELPSPPVTEPSRPGKTIISNDGATILKELEVVHPAAKTLVDIAKSQDAEDELAKEMEELEQEELDEQLLAAGPSAAELPSPPVTEPSRPGKTIITNDGATILKELEVVHPAAKTLVDIAKSQDAEKVLQRGLPVSDVDTEMRKNIEEFEDNKIVQRGLPVSDVDTGMRKNIEEFEKNILTWIKKNRAMLERIKILQEKNTPETVLHKASQTKEKLGVTDKESQTDEEVVVQVTEVKINAKDEFPSPVTLFVGNISKDFPDLLPHLFQQHGEILHWIQNKDENGKENDFAYCEFKYHQSALKALKILHNYKWGDKKLTVKIADGKTEDSYQRSKSVQNEAWPPILHGQNSPILASCINTIPSYPVSGASIPSTDASLMSQQNVILKEVIQNISNQLDNVTSYKHELEVKLANEKQKTNELQNNVDNLENSYLQLQLQTREIIEEKTKLKKENTNMKLNSEKFELDLKMYEVKTNSLKEAYQKQEEEINILKEKVKELKKELHHMTVKECDTFHEKQKAIEDVMEITLHLNEVTLYNSQLEQAETILKKEISTLTNEKNHLESQVQLLEEDYIKELDSMEKKYRHKYHKQEKLFEEKEFEIRREEQEEKENLKEQLQIMQQKNKSLTRQLEEYKKVL